LREQAKGLFCEEAAIELLIGHRCWLLRDDFVDKFVEIFENADTGAQMAFVDLSAAAEALGSGCLPCSSSEGQVLQLAASIAEGVLVDLRDTVCGLDATNAGLGARALLHAAGHRQAGVEIAEAAR
jgi:hypothetical protein